MVPNLNFQVGRVDTMHLTTPVGRREGCGRSKSGAAQGVPQQSVTRGSGCSDCSGRSLSGYLALLHDFVVDLLRTCIPSICLIARKCGRAGVLESSVLPVLKRLSWTTDRNLDVAWSCDVLVGSNHNLCGRCTVCATVLVGSYGSVQDLDQLLLSYDQGGDGMIP